jgi:methionyl-tRNA formyltransferase
VRVVFMGTPDFAVPSLEALVGLHEVASVFTRPDAAAGRGRALRPSAVKACALELGIPVVQPQTLRGEATRHLAELAPDVVCVAAYGLLLPPETLAVPPAGCINVHASLLPRHRGAAPIQRAILEGDVTTGISIMLMEEGLDTGPYLIQRLVDIDDRYADELERDLAHVGARALVDALRLIETGTSDWVPQDEARATYAAKITKDDVALSPDITVGEAMRRVRASTGRAPARACIGDRELTVVHAHPVAERTGEGAICVRDGLPVLGLSDGSLVLDNVRPSGKSDMSGADWVRGARIGEGVCWRCTR